MEQKSIYDSFYDAIMEIPFENSRFQDDHFVIESQHTPARKYRAILLRMSAKIRALQECQYSLRREDVDMEELEEKIATSQSKYDVARWKIDIEQKRANRVYTEKLVHDCLEEINYLKEKLKEYPRYTREQFEAEERKHFEIRLSKQALGITGPLESLDNMGIVDYRPENLLGIATQEIKLEIENKKEQKKVEEKK